MYEIVIKLAPPYLCDFCPEFVSDRCCYSLRSANNLCLPYVCADSHKKSFLFSSIKCSNSLPLEKRIPRSSDLFRHSLLKYLQFPSRNYLFFFFFLYWGSISVNISYSLDTYLSGLKHHLFFRKIAVYHQLELSAMHLLKIVNITFCNVPVLLLCVKTCLTPLDN